MVGQFTISPREVREACFGLELKADQIYRCDITITHRRVEDWSGPFLSHSLLKKYTDQINYTWEIWAIHVGMKDPVGHEID